MIPTKYVEELKNAPVKDVDFVATFFEVSVPRIVARIENVANEVYEDIRGQIHNCG